MRIRINDSAQVYFKPIYLKHRREYRTNYRKECCFDISHLILK